MEPEPEPDPKLDEIFSEARAQRCIHVFTQIFNHWRTTQSFEPRVIADESPEGKTLDQLRTMYFAVGVGEQLTDLPFLDMLIVFDLIKQAETKRQIDDTQPTDFRISTEWTKTKAFGMLSDIQTAHLIEVRGQGP